MRRLTSLSAAILLGLALTSCAADPPAASPDGGPVEDAATSDANGLDAARTDAGPGTDGGGDVDAAVDPDAAVDVDAAIDPDAGDLVDAGGATDAGTPATDAGTPAVDSGVVVPAGCILCHGDDTSMAPPVNLDRLSETTLRGVGAHRSHLGASSWHNEIVCQDCHIVPATVGAVGHMDTARPAELTWSALATADSAAPAFDGVTCSGAYCHGPTLQPGGSNTTPVWTTVNGTQAACGTCHGLPPGGSHTTSTACSTCHPTMDASGAIIDPALHINGIVDLNLTAYHPPGWAAPTSHGTTFNAGVPSACTSCHGATLTGGTVGVSCESCHPGWQTDCTFCHGNPVTGISSPPEGVNGQTSRLDITVGAHAEHVSATPLHSAWNCTFCHGPTTPTSVFSAGHLDGDSQAETVFGPILGAGTTYNATTGVCGNTYCHGTGTTRAAAPAWNTDPTLTCGSCHAPFTGATQAQLTAMSGEHDRHVRRRSVACNVCHGTSVSSTGTITNVAQHVNGVVEVSVPGFSATACGGTGGCSAAGAGCHGGDATVWCW